MTNDVMTNDLPFDFVLDYLPSNIIVKKMFGMYYIYLGKKIMLILRKRGNEPESNGIWVAVNKKHHESLKEQFPEFRALLIDSFEKQGNWLFIPAHTEEFETAAIKVCELISHGDPRIGRPTKKPPVA